MGEIEQDVQIAHQIFGDFQKLLGEKIIVKVGEKCPNPKPLFKTM